MVNKITTPPTTSELISTVNEIIDDKQDTLVSGINIKTINNTSILGSGNIDIQGGGSSYTAGTGISIASDVISVDSTVVTTGTNQDITGIKTFIGDKRIKFKQQTSSNKLGFTLYNNLGGEVGAFEYRPNTINGKAFIELNAAHGNAYVGFRYWSTTVNIVAPMAAAGTYFIPINLTDGNTTVTADDVGTVDISSLLPTKTSDLTNDSGYITSSALTPYVLSSSLATVATSGSYNDLSDKPTIPTVDQTYDGTSANAQSGVAVASAISGKADDSAVVHLAGTETITGVKSYSAMPALIFPDETRGTAPSSASYGGIAFRDNNGERMAILEKDHLTNGSISLNLRAASPTTTGTASQATLGVTYPMSGDPYATAPASDVKGSIVTTVNKSKTANGYFQLGNGLIINWGTTASGGSNTKTVTFSKAFTSTNYYAQANADRSGSTSSGWGYCTSRTKTGCDFTTGDSKCFWIAIGY